MRDAAARHQVDPALVKAVISTESGWNPQAVSRKGAVGLMQLIPGTAQRFGVGNPFDPAQNVEGGTTYLKSLLDRYNGDLTRRSRLTMPASTPWIQAEAFRRMGNATVRAKGARRILSPRLGPRFDALDSAKKSSAKRSGLERPGNFHERMDARGIRQNIAGPMALPSPGASRSPCLRPRKPITRWMRASSLSAPCECARCWKALRRRSAPSLITARQCCLPQGLSDLGAGRRSDAVADRRSELYEEMGRLFDAKYFQSAIDSYNFLLKQYPGSRYRAAGALFDWLGAKRRAASAGCG